MQNQVKDSNVPLYKVDGLTLSVLSKEDVTSLSVSQVFEEQFYRENGDPVTHGINDDLMGTMDKDRLCKTCMGSQVDCPGHFGHIKLSKPVFHYSMLDYVRKVLRCVCSRCSHLLSDASNNPELKKQLDQKALIRNSKSRFNAVFNLTQSLKDCPKCQSRNHKYRKAFMRIEIEIQDEAILKEMPTEDPKQVLWPEQAKSILEKITAEHLEKMGLHKVNANPMNLIIEDLAVAPPPVRPSVARSNLRRSEDDLTMAYRQIVKTNNELKRQISTGSPDTTIKELRNILQFYVATLMDNESCGGEKAKLKTGKSVKSIRERLKGKEGRLRGNLMGKRVDFSARTVITPDPNLRLDQLGVPIQIAMNLTVPEIVTQHNYHYLKMLVERGANDWPGAKYIKRIDGRYIDLSVLQNRSDQHLEVGYTVERHLNNDDYVIFNRQPSLHKMSLMGHRVKVLPFQTFRLNLSVTSPYNADFDGDEMNMHVPQSLETKAEIKEIMAVPRQIVAPQGNKPCMGIVQDSLLGIYRLTKRDTFLDKALVMNILMFIDYDLEKGLPQPAVLKPKPLWTGKQILSLVIPETINLQKDDEYSNLSKDDKMVVIQNGEVLCGIIAKGIVGAAAGGLIHVTWKDLGPQACSDLLSNIQFVVNNWLVHTGFTVGVQDIIAKPEIVQQVRQKIDMYKKKVRKVINMTQYGRLKSQPGKSTMESFEHQVNKRLNEARDVSGGIALKNLDKDNRLVNMVKSGSKGNTNNISQIMACCGQQNVEGKRIAFGFNKRSLPHFTKDDYSAESKGFVANSYLTGLTPSEFYFHAMGGREGLIDTAVKTADTGYISRRLMKALEDVMVKYDGTVRTSREIIIQFLYGEDGMAGEHFEKIPLDLPKLDNKALEKKCNFISNIADSDGYLEKLSQAMGRDRAQEIMRNVEVQKMFQDEFEQLKSDRSSLRHEIMRRGIEGAVPMPVNLPRVITNIKAENKIKPSSISDLDPEYFFKERKALLDSLCVLPQARLGNLENNSVISEAHMNSMMLFKIFLRRYLCAKKIIIDDRFDRSSFDQLIRTIEEIFKSAVVHPGEMVGSIGAQSMGEPATQMTLNTFHSAGIASMNVTLGVPRLKEVINVAKTIKTPSLKIFLTKDIENSQRDAVRVGDQIQYCNLASLVSEWGIYYDPDPLETVIQEDKDLIELYREVEELQEGDERNIAKWLLRFKMSSDPSQGVFNDYFEFQRDVVDRIKDACNDDPNQPIFQIVNSDDTSTSGYVIRIRPFELGDEEGQEVVMLLREMADQILNKITLRGFEKITKVFYTSSAADCVRTTFNEQTGGLNSIKDCWLIETDGVDLARVFSIEGVDATRTTSNHTIEILQVLGIEAARNSLIKELRMILGTYDIYVNYRHLSTLVDVMTQRGIFTSITRHGINRVNSGPLRKCSFEETAEILLEAAFFGEHDTLTGITENIIFGQLAPYGTGSVDLIVDQNALQHCIRMPGEDMRIYEQRTNSVNTLQDEPENELTEVVDKTPFPHDTMYEGGNTTYSAHVQNVSFTPNVDYYSGMSPSSQRSPGINSPGYGAQFQSPIHMSRMQSSSPYIMSPSGYGEQKPYSPADRGSNHAYSPTALQNPFMSPAYSPTTPNYVSNYPGGSVAMQQQTNSYAYGGPQPNSQNLMMPTISSPSQSPANRAHTSGAGANSYGVSNVYGSSAYPASPSYGVNIGTSRPGATQPAGAANKPLGVGAKAYDPVAAGADAAKNSDSSDSDK